jgi:hypothetical protein
MDPMSTPVTDYERKAIAEMLREGKSRADIRKATGRSAGTIEDVAREIGHEADQSSVARMRSAQMARSAFCAERRAESAAKAQERLDEILAGFFETQPVVVGGMGGAEVLTVKPDAKAIRDRASAIQTLQRMVLDVKRADERADEGQAKGLLERLVEGLDAGE